MYYILYYIKGMNYDKSKTSELNQVLEMIVEIFDPSQIVLFGSQARGDFREDSDFDLLIVDSAKPVHVGDLKIATVKARVKLVYEAIKTTSSEIEKYKNSPNHLLAKAMKEGVVLYERASKDSDSESR